MTSFKFEGGKELEAALFDLGKATAKNVARRVLRKAADPIVTKARMLAPKDEGDLEKSIKAGRAIGRFQRAGNRGDEVSVFVGIDESIDRRLRIYAGVQERGNDNNRPQPYMRPAWDAEKYKSVDRIAPELWDEISKAAARAAKKAGR